jgi:hypothetical protein
LIGGHISDHGSYGKRLWSRFGADDPITCEATRRPIKPAHALPRARGAHPMIAIAFILLFVAVLGALNLYEFGRLD